MNPLVSIAALSPKKQLAFALLVFERMLPGLIAFAQDTGFDDSCCLQAREAAWAALRDGAIDYIAHVLTLARDSLHLYLSTLEPLVVSSPEKDLRIAGHLLMQQEQRQEEDDVRFLSGLPEPLNKDAISALRT